MLTPWADTLDRAQPLPEYPRPQMVRDSYLNLNGPWSYAITTSANKPAQADGTILVPFSPESELSGVGHVLQPEEYLWYIRTVTLPDGFNVGRVLLHFGAVDQTATVWCNGVELATHTGGYLPFTVDITEVLAKENTILVCVRDATNKSQLPRGKQTLHPHGIWYTPQSGIWQTVWLESVPQNYIRSLHVTPLFDAHQVEITVEGEGQCMIDLEGKRFTFPAGVPAHVPVQSFRPWSPEHPTLYPFSVTLGDDTVYSYFAMRKCSIETDKDGVRRLFLNGKPYFHNGLLDQGYWPDGLYTAPSDDALVYDIQLAKDMGFNMLRKHIKIESARWYYHCDRLGMLVWQDAVSGGGTDGEYNAWTTNRKPTLIRSTWNKFRDDTAKHFTALGADDPIYRRDWSRTCDAMVHMLGGHPSIVTWTLFNEGWGQFDACDAAERIHALDPTRPIDATSGWYDQHCGDYHSVHNYFRPLEIYPDKGPLRGYVAEFEKRHRRRRRAAHYVVLPVARHGVRAFVISEFGGLAQLVPEHAAVSRAYGYGEYDSIDDWRAAVRSVLASAAALESRGLAGYVYTQVSDVEEELNGLLTYDRRVDKFAE